MKKIIDKTVKFGGVNWSPKSEKLSSEPSGFNYYIYYIKYNYGVYTLIISEQKNEDLYIPVVKKGYTTIEDYLNATNVAPPNYALGLGVGVDEVEVEVEDLIVNYRRNTVSLFNGTQRLKDDITTNDGGIFISSQIFG